MKSMRTRKLRKCQVANCDHVARYKNDRSGLVYCTMHAEQNKFKIKMDAQNTGKLLKIPELV